MANQKTDFEYLTWILNHRFACKDKNWMKEEKVAKGKRSQRVEIYSGPGIRGYELYEFGDKENCRHLPFFNNTNNHKDLPNAPSGLIAFCDYILLVEFKQLLHIVLIELKRGSTTHARLQLEASKVFMQYVLNSAERIKDDNNMEMFDKGKTLFRKGIITQNEKEPLNSHLPKNFNKNDVLTYTTSKDFYIREIL